MSALSVRGALRSFEGAFFLYRQSWKNQVASTFLGPLMYLGAIGFGLGSLVDAEEASLGTFGDGSPVTYVAFLAAGLIAATGVQIGGQEGIFGAQERVKWRGTWKVEVSTPLMPSDLALANLLWCGFRGALAAAVYGLITGVLGILPVWRGIAAAGPALLGAMALSGLLTVWIVSTDEDHVMNAANRFVVIPMFLFSGVFFPISQLPGWMQPIAQATPMWHAVVLSRAVALDQPTPWGAVIHLAVLLAFAAVGLGWGMVAFRRRLLS